MMENLGLWLVVLLVSALLSAGSALASWLRWHRLAVLAPQALALFVALVFAVTARLGGGWEALGYTIMSVLLALSAAISGAVVALLIGLGVIKKKD